jgi:hypothetical protein
MTHFNRQKCEFLRQQAKQKFEQVRSTWIECGRWAAPHRTKWLLSQTPGERNNYHVVDPTHIIALRSYVAGFLEGNTSASRPWYRIQGQDPDVTAVPENYAWLHKFTRRTLACLASSNYYHAAGQIYYDYGTFNTAAHFIDEIDGHLFFHTLTPGSYFVINDGFGVAAKLVREFSLNVSALVSAYGAKRDGKADWSNFSTGVRKMYEDGNYAQTVDVAQVVEENEAFDPRKPIGGENRKWVSKTYEVGSAHGQYNSGESLFGSGAHSLDPRDADRYLKISFSKRKPFVVTKSEMSNNFEYGEKGPTLDALGLIKSLNKKAIGKDRALEQMLAPAIQGPANLRKSYVTTAPNSYVPLDAHSLSQKGLRQIFEVNPAVATLNADIGDLRQQVDKLYYADYLLYLSRNPKTRTATETNAIVQEQQLIIGPNLQSLNWTYNVPVVEFVMDFVLDEDPYLEPPPESLAGQFLRAEFVSVFAQAQKAADLPSIERYIAGMMNVAQLDPRAMDKVNLDKLADLYEDRLYLPSGLNNPQAKVDAMREQAQAQAQRQQMLEQTLPAMAGAAKDVGLTMQPKGEQK